MARTVGSGKRNFETVIQQNVLKQIDEMQYAASMEAKGISAVTW